MDEKDTITVCFTESGDYSVGIMPTDIATMQIYGACAEALINDGTLEAFKTEMETLITKYFEPEGRLETTDSTQPPEP